MKTFTFQIQLQAEGAEQAQKKMQSLQTILQKLSEKELAKIAHILTHDAITTSMLRMKLGLM